MHHYLNAITDTKGNALIGYFARCVDTTTASGATLYSDESLTPIISVSGVADAAKVNSDGNVDFYLSPGTYHLDIYAADSTTFIRRIASVPMTDDNTLRTDLAASTGSTLILHKSAGANTFGRTLRQWATVGGMFDNNLFNWIDSNFDPDILANGGASDCTAAFTNAISYIASNGNSVILPVVGTFPTDAFQIDSQVTTKQAFFRGFSKTETIIQRRTAGAGAFVTIGDPSATVFQAGLVCANLTINGGPAGVSGDTLLAYDLVRSQFDNVVILGGTAALHLHGGVGLDFLDCAFQFAQKGVVGDHFSSLAGGGYPNLIRFINPVITNHSIRGLELDYGRMLLIDGGDFESNGTTTGDASQGDIWVGANEGSEVTDPTSIGAIVARTWFENSKGIANIHLNSGSNAVRDCNFVSANTTNNIKVDGGNYELENLKTGAAKTANLLEGAGVASGNRIDAETVKNFGNLSYDPTKTTTLPAVGVGYATGSGGTVTQATSKSTGVTLNKPCGQITLNNAALAASAVVTFPLTNGAIVATDYVDVWVSSGNATPGTYRCWSEGNGAGSRTICLQNISAGSLSEAVVLGFGVNKRVAA